MSLCLDLDLDVFRKEGQLIYQEDLEELFPRGCRHLDPPQGFLAADSETSLQDYQGT